MEPAEDLNEPEELQEKDPDAELNSDQGYFDQVFQRCTTTLEDGRTKREPLPRRYVTFTMDCAVCCPGTFDMDFKMTLKSLTAGQELGAARESGGDAVTMGFLLAKMAIHAVNGRSLSMGKGEVDWMWEAVGQGGRALIAGMFAEALGTQGAQGKAHETLQLH